MRRISELLPDSDLLTAQSPGHFAGGLSMQDGDLTARKLIAGEALKCA